MCTRFVVCPTDKKYHMFLAFKILSVSSFFKVKKILQFEMCIFITFLAQKAECLITSIVRWSCQWNVWWKRPTIIAYGKEKVLLHQFCEGNLILVGRCGAYG